MQTKEQKQIKVAELKSKRSKRSPSEQLQVLDQRLGKNVGAVKERFKLNSKINEQI